MPEHAVSDGINVTDFVDDDTVSAGDAPLAVDSLDVPIEDTSSLVAAPRTAGPFDGDEAVEDAGHDSGPRTALDDARDEFDEAGNRIENLSTAVEDTEEDPGTPAQGYSRFADDAALAAGGGGELSQVSEGIMADVARPLYQALTVPGLSGAASDAVRAKGVELLARADLLINGVRALDVEASAAGTVLDYYREVPDLLQLRHMDELWFRQEEARAMGGKGRAIDITVAGGLITEVLFQPHRSDSVRSGDFDDLRKALVSDELVDSYGNVFHAAGTDAEAHLRHCESVIEFIPTAGMVAQGHPVELSTTIFAEGSGGIFQDHDFSGTSGLARAVLSADVVGSPYRGGGSGDDEAVSVEALAGESAAQKIAAGVDMKSDAVTAADEADKDVEDDDSEAIDEAGDGGDVAPPAPVVTVSGSGGGGPVGGFGGGSPASGTPSGLTPLGPLGGSGGASGSATADEIDIDGLVDRLGGDSDSDGDTEGDAEDAAKDGAKDGVKAPEGMVAQYGEDGELIGYVREEDADRLGGTGDEGTDTSGADAGAGGSADGSDDTEGASGGSVPGAGATGGTGDATGSDDADDTAPGAGSAVNIPQDVLDTFDPDVKDVLSSLKDGDNVLASATSSGVIDQFYRMSPETVESLRSAGATGIADDIAKLQAVPKETWSVVTESQSAGEVIQSSKDDTIRQGLTTIPPEVREALRGTPTGQAVAVLGGSPHVFDEVSSLTPEQVELMFEVNSQEMLAALLVQDPDTVAGCVKDFPAQLEHMCPGSSAMVEMSRLLEDSEALISKVAHDPTVAAVLEGARTGDWAPALTIGHDAVVAGLRGTDIGDVISALHDVPALLDYASGLSGPTVAAMVLPVDAAGLVEYLRLHPEAGVEMAQMPERAVRLLSPSLPNVGIVAALHEQFPDELTALSEVSSQRAAEMAAAVS